MKTIVISNIKISSFRSIININLKIDSKNNFITFCGANNVGKTNILNALALFFNKIEYIAEKDCPHYKYYGTQGGRYQPKIIITFKENDNSYIIEKDWKLTKDERKKESKAFKIKGKKNGETLSTIEATDFLKKVHFFYLPSINISFPETIKYIMNSDIIDLETRNTRLSGKKKEMKDSIEKTLRNLQELLDKLGDSISPLLSNYHDGWGLAFDLPKEVNTFRDLMIAEVDFYIKDKSHSKEIDAKGAGLQRLCHILMHFRMIQKLNDNKESVILLIDEPDVYLHSGLQKKLLDDFYRYIDKNQIFVTTHSPIFIDTVKLSNVFLLDQKIEEDVEFARAKRKNIENKKFNKISTELINFSESNGISKLKAYLGIEDKDSLLYDKYNLLVEGDSDVAYLSKLMTHFNIEVPNMIPCAGADNIIKYLEFYNSIGEKSQQNTFVVILDNDNKGREVFDKIRCEIYKNIIVKKKYIITYSGYNADKKDKANIEIEDFMKPRIICYLINEILALRKFNKFTPKNIREISKSIQTLAFRNRGILALLEHKKNELNPDNGQDIKIEESGVKKNMAKLFSKLDTEIISLIGSVDDKDNIEIVEFLREISFEVRETLF